MKKPEVIRVTITKPHENNDKRWTLFLADDSDGEVLASVQLNQGLSRYIRSTLAMIEDDLPERN